MAPSRSVYPRTTWDVVERAICLRLSNASQSIQPDYTSCSRPIEPTILSPSAIDSAATTIAQARSLRIVKISSIHPWRPSCELAVPNCQDIVYSSAMTFKFTVFQASSHMNFFRLFTDHRGEDTPPSVRLEFLPRGEWANRSWCCQAKYHPLAKSTERVRWQHPLTPFLLTSGLSNASVLNCGSIDW
jgi:hypothetical protein